jgi:hypothetical protein
MNLLGERFKFVPPELRTRCPSAPLRCRAGRISVFAAFNTNPSDPLGYLLGISFIVAKGVVLEGVLSAPGLV